MNPRLLILETSGRVGHVAVAEGTELRRAQRLEETRRHARDLAPAVSALLAAEGWKPADIHAVLVSRGPGSYTGLRVGIMSAKAFAYATGCALLAMDTFAAVASQAPAEASQLDVLADAQQEKIYVQRFARAAPETSPLASSPLMIETFTNWLERRENSVWVSGPGLEKFRDRLPEGSHVVDNEFWDPRPASLLRLGLQRYQNNERDDMWSLEPLYLRPSSAEEKWQGRRTS